MAGGRWQVVDDPVSNVIGGSVYNSTSCFGTAEALVIKHCRLQDRLRSNIDPAGRQADGRECRL